MSSHGHGDCSTVLVVFRTLELDTEVGLAATTPHGSRLLARLLTLLSTQELAIGRGCFRTSCAHLWPRQVVQPRPRDQDWYLFITRVGSGGEGRSGHFFCRVKKSIATLFSFFVVVLSSEIETRTQTVLDATRLNNDWGDTHRYLLWSWSFLGVILYIYVFLRSYWSTSIFRNIQGINFVLNAVCFQMRFNFMPWNINYLLEPTSFFSFGCQNWNGERGHSFGE